MKKLSTILVALLLALVMVFACACAPKAEAPADEPAVEAPADKPAEEPADKPADEPADEPVEEPEDDGLQTETYKDGVTASFDPAEYMYSADAAEAAGAGAFQITFLLTMANTTDDTITITRHMDGGLDALGQPTKCQEREVITVCRK